MKPLPHALPDFTGRVNAAGESIIISAPAKINLFLKVMGRRPDGYHNIFSWFQALDLCDHLEIEKSPDPAIKILTDAENIPTGPGNIVYQAAEAMKQRLGYAGGFCIRLWKKIPVGAGLGGGSSDAAAVIKGIVRLLGREMKNDEMAEIGLGLGSDVPFFFSPGQAEVTGRGEKVKSIELPVDYQVALVTPPFEIRAAEAYRKLKLDLTAPVMDIKFNRCREARDFFCIVSSLDNDLEWALRESYPILDEIGGELKNSGADIVRISGSGPTVFALYTDTTVTENVLRNTFRGEGWGLNLARPIILPA